MAPRRTHENDETPRVGTSRSIRLRRIRPTGWPPGWLTGLDVSGLVTTGEVDSRPGAVLLLLVELQAPTASVAAKDEQGEQGTSYGVLLRGSPPMVDRRTVP